MRQRRQRMMVEPEMTGTGVSYEDCVRKGEISRPRGSFDLARVWLDWGKTDKVQHWNSSGAFEKGDVVALS